MSGYTCEFNLKPIKGQPSFNGAAKCRISNGVIILRSFGHDVAAFKGGRLYRLTDFIKTETAFHIAAFAHAGGCVIPSVEAWYEIEKVNLVALVSGNARAIA